MWLSSNFIITFGITILTLVVGIFSTWGYKSIANLKSELQTSRKEIAETKEELDNVVKENMKISEDVISSFGKYLKDVERYRQELESAVAEARDEIDKSLFQFQYKSEDNDQNDSTT